MFIFLFCLSHFFIIEFLSRLSFLTKSSTFFFIIIIIYASPSSSPYSFLVFHLFFPPYFHPFFLLTAFFTYIPSFPSLLSPIFLPATLSHTVFFFLLSFPPPLYLSHSHPLLMVLTLNISLLSHSALDNSLPSYPILIIFLPSHSPHSHLPHCTLPSPPSYSLLNFPLRLPPLSHSCLSAVSLPLPTFPSSAPTLRPVHFSHTQFFLCSLPPFTHLPCLNSHLAPFSLSSLFSLSPCPYLCSSPLSIHTSLSQLALSHPRPPFLSECLVLFVFIRSIKHTSNKTTTHVAPLLRPGSSAMQLNITIIM